MPVLPSCHLARGSTGQVTRCASPDSSWPGHRAQVADAVRHAHAEASWLDAGHDEEAGPRPGWQRGWTYIGTGSRPGELVAPGGVAASTDDPFANYLKPGDVVEAEIEHLGVLRNPVISWRDSRGTDAPPADSWV